MEENAVICEVELEVRGIRRFILVYERKQGGCFALTRFRDRDVISNGSSLKEALKRHVERLAQVIGGGGMQSCRQVMGGVAK